MIIVYTVEKSTTAVLHTKLSILIPQQSQAYEVERFKTKRAYKKWVRNEF